MVLNVVGSNPINHPEEESDNTMLLSFYFAENQRCSMLSLRSLIKSCIGFPVFIPYTSKIKKLQVNAICLRNVCEKNVCEIFTIWQRSKQQLEKMTEEQTELGTFLSA